MRLQAKARLLTGAKNSFFIDGPPKDGKLSTDKCALCNKSRGHHQAKTHNCPMGSRGRAGTYSFHSNNKFKDKK